MTADARTNTGDWIVERCLELGFATAGICDALPSEHADHVRDWIARGRHGSMAYLERNLDLRLDPRKALASARSIIMVADQYGARTNQVDPPLPGGAGRIARYAQGRDYHTVIRRRLHTLCDELRARFPSDQFRAFVDTAPILEREHAARAGLGWVGKHTLLIDPRLGSYLFLGGVLTTLAIEPPASQTPVPDYCGTCTRCVDACPTDAITPYSVDASRCIAYLTIENRGRIAPGLVGSVGAEVFGCDVCQQVCPHNSARTHTVDRGAPRGDYAPRRTTFDLLEILGWAEDDRRRTFESSALKRATLAMMKRNALIALGNSLAHRDDPPARARIRAIAADDGEPALVRDTAREVLDLLAMKARGASH